MLPSSQTLRQPGGIDRCHVRPPSLVQSTSQLTAPLDNWYRSKAKGALIQPTFSLTNWMSGGLATAIFAAAMSRGTDRRHILPPFVVSQMPCPLIAQVTPPELPMSPIPRRRLGVSEA